MVSICSAIMTMRVTGRTQWICRGRSICVLEIGRVGMVSMDFELPSSWCFHRNQPFSFDARRIRRSVHQGVEVIAFIVLRVTNFSEEMSIFEVNSSLVWVGMFSRDAGGTFNSANGSTVKGLLSE